MYKSKGYIIAQRVAINKMSMRADTGVGFS